MGRSIIFLLICISLTSQAQTKQPPTPNPYNLITDKELTNQAPHIKKFWQRGNSNFFLGINNIKISYRQFLNPKKEAAIILINGRGESYIKYQLLAYEFYQIGYSVYLYDHRGQGLSDRMLTDKQMGYVKKFDNYVQDLATFYQTKITPQKHKKTFILSHSMGGTVSLLYAKKYPNTINAIALSAPMLGLNNEMAMCSLAKSIKWIKGVFGLQPDYALTQKKYTAVVFEENNPNLKTHSKAHHLNTLSLYEQYPQAKLGGVTTMWLVQACNAMQTIRTSLTKIKTPLLLLQASEDTIVSLSAQNAFCENIKKTKNPGCQDGAPKVLKGSYHELLIEEDTFRIPATTSIINFFKKHKK
jgi:lysophospholipase